MAHSIAAGIWISADNNTWYKLTDDNREPIHRLLLEDDSSSI